MVKLPGLMAAIAYACVALAEDTNSAAPAPVIACDAPSHDFGVTNSDSSVSHQFTLRNAGNALLIISRVRQGCGCTTAVLSTNLVQPGETFTLDMAFNLRGRYGLQSKGVAIESNDSQTPFFRLNMKGTAEMDLSITPRAIHFGPRTPDEFMERYCDIVASTTVSFKVKGFDMCSTAFTGSIVTNEPGKSYRFIVRPASSAYGRAETIASVLTDHPRLARISIPITQTVVYDLAAVPAMISLFASETNRFSPRVITIASRSGKPFKITEVVMPDQDCRYTTQPAENGRQRLIINEMHVTPALHGKSIKVITDASPSEPIVISISFHP